MALTGLAKWLSDRYNDKVGTPLGWTETTWNNIVADALEAMGGDEVDFEDIALHKVGYWQMWDKVKSDIALDFSYSADGASYSLGDVDVDGLWNKSFAEALPYLGSSYEIHVDWGETDSPYIYTVDRDNAGNF
jgi:hypothetical protein